MTARFVIFDWVLLFFFLVVGAEAQCGVGESPPCDPHSLVICPLPEYVNETKRSFSVFHSEQDDSTMVSKQPPEFSCGWLKSGAIHCRSRNGFSLKALKEDQLLITAPPSEFYAEGFYTCHLVPEDTQHPFTRCAVHHFVEPPTPKPQQSTPTPKPQQSTPTPKPQQPCEVHCTECQGDVIVALVIIGVVLHIVLIVTVIVISIRHLRLTRKFLQDIHFGPSGRKQARCDSNQKEMEPMIGTTTTSLDEHVRKLIEEMTGLKESSRKTAADIMGMKELIRELVDIWEMLQDTALNMSEDEGAVGVSARKTSIESTGNVPVAEDREYAENIAVAVERGPLLNWRLSGDKSFHSVRPSW